MARAGGERSDEEKILLNAKIKEVQAGLDEVKEQQKMLKMQEKKIMDELVVKKRNLRDSIAAKKELANMIAELELVNGAAVAQASPSRGLARKSARPPGKCSPASAGVSPLGSTSSASQDQRISTPRNK